MRRTLASIGIAAVCFGSLTVAGGRPNVRPASSLGEAFDSRASAPGIPPNRLQVSAIVALVREHPDVRFGWNTRFGTPATILRHGAALTGPSAGTPATAARVWLRRQAALFGWRPGAVATLKEIKTLTQPNGGPVIVLLHQVFAGYEGYSFGGSLVVGLDRANRVLSVRANVVRIRAIAEGSRRSAADALRIASGRAPTAIRGKRNGWIEFARGTTPAPHFVRKIAFPVGNRPARPAWEVHLTERLDSRYRTVVDASTGEILYRHQMVNREAPEGRVFENHPGAKRGGTHEMVSFKGDPTASPNGWLIPNAPATTFGNNAVTATHWIAGQAPEGLGQVRPVSANGSFDVAFQNAWNSSECGGSLPVYGPGATPTFARDAEPAVLNLFYHHNVMHDYFYGLGFDEKAGALQVQNFGRGGKENDPLHGLAQAGATVLALNSNNAYMSTDEDGLPSWSGMFLFMPIPGIVDFPCVDGDFDSNIIYHEYTHAVSSRWVGGEFGNLDTFQGGSMGESWSDFYATHYLFSRGLETNDAVGLYATGDLQRGIRNWAMSDVEANFGDIGYDGSPEVHADGEIWNGVLWDIRTTLAKARRGGADLAAQLIADAMPLSGPSPSMLDMRNAILAADLARTKGANQSVLWTVFSRHGMGFSAKTKDGNDIDPIPAFDHKDAAMNETLLGRVVDPVSGKPVPTALITFSRFEQGVTPVTRTAADGTFRIRLSEDTHAMKVSLPGYGSQIVKLKSVGGRIRTGVFSLGSNYASSAIGAKVVMVSSEATPGSAALVLDEAESSAWSTRSAKKAQFLTVKLAGDVPVSISGFRLSAFVATRSDALKDWTLLTSLDGKNFREVAHGTFVAGRLGPAVHDLTFHEGTLAKPVRASYLKLVAKSAQSASATSIGVADLQVFGSGDGFKATVVKQVAFHIDALLTVPVPTPIEPSNNSEPVLLPTAFIFENTCVYPPPTQGLDGYVVELPQGFGDGKHSFTVEGESLPNPVVGSSTDIDLYFYDADCNRLGHSFLGVNPETGALPAGTKYVVLELFELLPANVSFDAHLSSPVSLSHVGIPKPKPPKVGGLAATGIGGISLLGLGAVFAAGAVALAVKRSAR